MVQTGRHGAPVPRCIFLCVILSCTVLRVSTFTVFKHLSIHSAALNVPSHVQLLNLKSGGRSDCIIRRTGYHTLMSQAGDLSEEDQTRSKKLADAWIRQDKASECSKLLQVHFWKLNLFWAPNKAASAALNHRAKAYTLLDRYPQELNLLLCFFPRGLEVTGACGILLNPKHFHTWSWYMHFQIFGHNRNNRSSNRQTKLH